MRLVCIDRTDHPLLEQVIQLGDDHRATLGLLPRQGFVDRAAAGTMIAAVADSGGVAGYALYDLPDSSVRLVHLCVGRGVRGQGLARKLVEDLERRHPERLRIRLKCRPDFDADGLWPRLGFVPVAEVIGRSLSGHPLTVWHKPLREQPSLFDVDTSTTTSRLLVVLDTNVFLDLTDDERSDDESDALRADWVNEEVELVYTDELLRELRLGAQASERRRARGAALQFRRLPVRHADAERVEEDLLKALGNPRLTDRCQRDVRHVAHAAAGGAHYLVTRDAWLANHVGPMAQAACGITVRTPGELVLELDRQRRIGEYRPGALLATPLVLDPLVPGEANALAERFVDHGHGEQKRQLARRLRALAADPEQWSSRVVRHERTPVALVVWSQGTSTDQVAVLRVAPTWSLGATVARQLLYARRQARAKASIGCVHVTDTHVSPAVERALVMEGFFESERGWSCSVVPVVAPLGTVLPGLHKGDWLPAGHPAHELMATLSPDTVTADQAAELERGLWPLKITNAPLCTYLVPIQPRYAEALFDETLASQTLFPRDLQLGVARQHVYYRSPYGPRLRTPARLLWYVSGERHRPGVQCVRAVSFLDEIVVDEPERLYQRFAHLGVYELADVRQAAKHGRTMALRFSYTELLPLPVAHRWMEDRARRYGHTLVVRSIAEVPATLFADAYREGVHG